MNPRALTDGADRSADPPEVGATAYFSSERSIEAVNARIGDDASERLATVMRSLTAHLHTFVKEVGLTQEEWEAAVSFLTRTGQICSKERQEFILLSDVLGLSMLVDAINNRRPEGSTENTVLGPFHVADAPLRSMGERICLDGKGESCLFDGRVLDPERRPISGACIDVWSDNADGYYDVQQLDLQPRWNNRGRFITGEDGRYAFVGIKPVSYPIPNDGPVGQLLAGLGRHPYRPAHMHYIVTRPGYQKLVTHIFCGEDEYIESDAVVGVKSSLIGHFEKPGDDQTLWRASFDFVMTRSDDFSPG